MARNPQYDYEVELTATATAQVRAETPKDAAERAESITAIPEGWEFDDASASRLATDGGAVARDAASRAAPLTLHDLTCIVGAQRRRLALRILYEREPVDGDAGPLDVADLARDVAAAEFGEDYATSEKQSVYRTLRQSHLPTLAALDVIEYDEERYEVRAGPHLDLATAALFELSHLAGGEE